jgi:SAM-dependent methyltransferase
MFSHLKKILRNLIKQRPPQWFLQDYQTLQNQEQASTSRFTVSEANLYPCLNDRSSSTPFDRHYIYHPAWAAQVLAQTKPAKHIDISSTLHFSTMLAAFMPTEFYDYRPADIVLNNYYSAKADLTNLFFEENAVQSLSCMHTVEHIGLGRYGDPVDYDGDLKAMKELARVLAPGGTLLFVTPVGKEDKIFFNAHRIYTANSIKKYYESFGLILKEFVYIPQKSGSYQVEHIEAFTTTDNYGCGCFWFTK